MVYMRQKAASLGMAIAIIARYQTRARVGLGSYCSVHEPWGRGTVTCCRSRPFVKAVVERSLSSPPSPESCARYTEHPYVRRIYHFDSASVSGGTRRQRGSVTTGDHEKKSLRSLQAQSPFPFSSKGNKRHPNPVCRVRNATFQSG